MKLLYRILLGAILLNSSAHAAIQGMSNISKDQVVVSLEDDESSGRSLILLNLRTLAKQKISLPADTESEEVMGLVLSPSHLILISQWTAGGGKNPYIHEYDIAKKQWAKKKELNCLSFDRVEIKGSVATIPCEAGGSKKVDLGLNLKTPLKVVFPLKQDKQGADSVKLSGGSIFRWQMLEVQEGKKAKKIFKATDLLKDM